MEANKKGSYIIEVVKDKDGKKYVLKYKSKTKRDNVLKNIIKTSKQNYGVYNTNISQFKHIKYITKGKMYKQLSEF